MGTADVVFYLAATGAVVAGWLVFRTDSMVRAAFWLLASFAAAAVVILLLQAELLFAITVLMMTGEMTIMAVFMVMFMMNPGGLMPMQMVHLPRLSAGAGVAVFSAFTAAVLLSDFPARTRLPPPDVNHALGIELLGPSMVIFETAGVALLTTMIAGVALTSKRGRFGDAIDASPGQHGGGGHDHHGGHG